MHFVLILHKCCRSENNFYVSNYDLTSSKYCKSFSLEFSIFTEKFTKIGLMNYADRGIAAHGVWCPAAGLNLETGQLSRQYTFLN